MHKCCLGFVLISQRNRDSAAPPASGGICNAMHQHAEDVMWNGPMPSSCRQGSPRLTCS